jgi:hypothetical protein
MSKTVEKQPKDIQCGFCGVRRTSECSRVECPKREHLTARPHDYGDVDVIAEGCSITRRARGAE